MEPTLRLLGTPEVRVGDEVERPPDWPAAFLAFVVAHEGGVSRGEVAGTLWPEVEERKARHNLSQFLYRHRDAAWLAGLEVTAQRLRWRGGEDVGPFRAAVADGAWARAVEAYGGPLLRDVRLDDADGVAAWLEAERAELEAAWREATLRYADDLTSSGRHADAADALRGLLAADPLAEDVVQAYMRAAAAAGRRAAALEAHEAFASLVRAELELDPLPGTERLAEAIRAADADVVGSGTVATAPPATTNGRGRRGAPSIDKRVSSWTAFVGRDIERAELAGVFRDGRRLLTLVGPGGVGKTHLAVQVAHENADRFEDGVGFVPLAELASEANLAAAVAAELGVEVPARGARNALLDAVGDRELLIVLDEYEHLLPAVEEISVLLAEAPRLSFLVTSREPLGLQAEWTYQVAGLDTPPAGDDANVHVYDAVQLFHATARRVDSGFVLRDDHAPAVARICRIVDGLPLGVELAARWVRLLSPPDLADELSHDLDLLQADRGDVPARHRSLRAVFLHSWSLLGPDERVVLARLSVFRGGFGVEAARAVTTTSLRTLLALTHKSLLTRSQDGRFTLPPSIRQFAAEALAEDAADEASTRERHARHFMALAERAEVSMRGAEQIAWMDALGREHPNLRAALRWAEEVGEAEIGLRTAGALQMFWWTRGAYQEGIEAYTALLALSGAEAMPALRAKSLHRMGTLLEEEAGYTRAEEAYGRALELAEEAGESRLAADAEHSLGLLASKRGDLDAAFARYARSLELQRGIGDQWGLSVTLNNMAIAKVQQGRFEEAKAPFEESLQVKRELGEAQGIAYALNNLATVHVCLGELATARHQAEESLALKRRLGDEQGIATSLANLGRIDGGEGDLHAARHHFGESVRRLAELRHDWRLVWVLTAVVDVEGRHGRPDRALRLAGGVERLVGHLGVTLTAPSTDELARGTRAARDVLDEDRARALLADGRGMERQGLVALVVDAPDPARADDRPPP